MRRFEITESQLQEICDGATPWQRVFEIRDQVRMQSAPEGFTHYAKQGYNSLTGIYWITKEIGSIG